MSHTRMIGLVILGAGVTLVIFRYYASQFLGERVVEGITGCPSSQTIWLLIGCLAASVGGGAQAIWAGRRHVVFPLPALIPVALSKCRGCGRLAR